MSCTFHVLVKVLTSRTHGKRSVEEVSLVLVGLSATRMGDMFLSNQGELNYIHIGQGVFLVGDSVAVKQ